MSEERGGGKNQRNTRAESVDRITHKCVFNKPGWHQDRSRLASRQSQSQISTKAEPKPKKAPRQSQIGTKAEPD
jgi:hypothetical protein